MPPAFLQHLIIVLSINILCALFTYNVDTLHSTLYTCRMFCYVMCVVCRRLCVTKCLKFTCTGVNQFLETKKFKTKLILHTTYCIQSIFKVGFCTKISSFVSSEQRRWKMFALLRCVNLSMDAHQQNMFLHLLSTRHTCLVTKEYASLPRFICKAR